MAKTMFLFYTNCKIPEREQELSDWYDNIHIPDVEAIPGFTSCTRHRITDRQFGTESRSQEPVATYLSIVEANLGVDAAVARLSEATMDWIERGRLSDLFDVVESKIITEENPSHAFSQVTAA